MSGLRLLLAGLILLLGLEGLAVAQEPPAGAGEKQDPLAGAMEQEEPPAGAVEAPDPEQDRAALRAGIREVVQRTDVVLVTATRTASPLFELPYRAESVGRGELALRRILQDALEEVPGIAVQRTSYGQASPYLRGLTGYHTVLLVDGIRLNNSVLRSGPNEYWGLVDPLSLDHLEVVLGPGSVLYGSDAVGGTVNAITLSRFPTGESSWDRRIFLRYSSAEDSLIGRAQIAGNAGDDFGFVLGATGGAFDELDAGGDLGRQEATDYHNYFGDAHFTIPLDEHWSLGVLAQAGFLRDVTRVHRTVFGVRFHGSDIGDDLRHELDFERELFALTLTGLDLDGFVDSVEVRLSYQRIVERRDRIRAAGVRDQSGFDVGTYGIAVQLGSETPIGRLTYGLDWYHDEVDSFRRDFDAMGVFTGEDIQGPVGDDARYDLAGLFVQDEIPVCEELDVIVGGRLTYARAEADQVADPANAGARIRIDDDWVAAVGSAKAIWKPLEELRIWGGVSQAFRAPNLSDLTRLDVARSSELEVPSPGLDPEHFVAFEAGAKVRAGGFTGDFGYHFTLLDDVIIRRPTAMMVGGDTIVVKGNDGDGHVQGVELRAAYAFDEHWSVRGAFSWTDGQIDAFPTAAPFKEEEPLTRLPPIQGLIAIRWQSEDGDFWIEPSVVIVDGQDRLSSSDRRDTQRIPPDGTPGYTLFNVHAGYRFCEDSYAFLGIENIGDKNYRLHGSGVQEAGFNVVVGVDVTF